MKFFQKIYSGIGNLLTKLVLTSDVVAVTMGKYQTILENKYQSRNVALIPHGSFETPEEPDFTLPAGPKKILAFGKFGIEKESLRVSQSTISRQKHQESMGSPLCHRYITTDFSEAQLELITPPLIDKKMGLNFLENIHHFVSHKIEDEIIWPFSMPPFIQSDTEIPIASYGSSNLALFKTTYRNGLSHRYGRTMQAISGIHFNYSLPEQIWKSSLFTKQKEDLKVISFAKKYEEIFNFSNHKPKLN